MCVCVFVGGGLLGESVDVCKILNILKYLSQLFVGGRERECVLCIHYICFAVESLKCL